MSNMFLNIVSTFKGEGIKQANGAITSFQTGLKPFSSLLGKAAAGLAAFGVTAKSISFGRESIEAARDLERNLFGIDKVFGSLGPQMQQFSKDAVEMGLSQSKAAKATTFIGSVLKQSGFEMSDVAVETKNLISLAQDLSTLYGYDVQEALLGMTALFRGEYDPIEKFGVAMKQQEINSELAARGLDKLQGAALRNAEQTVRLELLYERSADAVGTFAEQSGTLYVEQKKLGATFENFQANLGGAVIPAVAELNTLFRELLEDITPGMQSAFGFLAEILSGVIGLIQDAMDPNTELGESVAALGIQFESLFKTIFGQDVSIADFFDAAGFAIGKFFDFLHDTMIIVENLIIGFQVMGEQINLLLTGQFAELLAFDAAGEIRRRIDLRDTINENKLAVKQYIAEWDRVRALQLSGHLNQVSMTADQMERLARASASVRPMLTGTADNMERQINAMNRATQATVTAVSTVRSSLGSSSVSSTPSAAAGSLNSELDQAARTEQERLNQREAAFKSFADSVKSTFGQIKDSILASFNLPELGKSTNSITKNIKSLLEKTRAFAKNITQLSAQGLTNDLLQQLIQAGPLSGGNLAKALVSGGSAFIGQLNESYGEFSGLAGGIADVGTRSAFAREQVVNNFNIEVNTVAGDPIAIERVVLDAISRANRRGTTGLTV
jgi:hypothetical protein